MQNERDQIIAIGFLSGSCCPHYDGEAERRPSYHRLLLDQSIIPGIAIDDGVGVHFLGTEPHQIVTPREKASAYHVSVADGTVREEPISVPLARLHV
ncbi:MAG TPA: Type 1 glutamine amidotransferase-like domain-containing protein [Candidatus Binatia bacterium]|nr:Type 1 glutamine amidotransferase-like domain-containing protein [Candidatus Binatia bacterium]